MLLDIVETNQLFKEKIESFSKLEKNWDSYDADVVDSLSILRAKNIVDMLTNEGIKLKHCVPTRDGGIQLETGY